MEGARWPRFGFRGELGDTCPISAWPLGSSSRVKGRLPCQYQSERCLVQRRVHVVPCGRPLQRHSQIAHSASSLSLITLLAQHAAHTTAVRFLTSNLYSELLAKLAVEIDSELLELAFTHRSFAYEAGLTATNERLEFLGDSVLGLVVTEELYRKYPDLDESRLSPLRSGIVNMRALADIARSLELGKYIRLGKGEEVTNGRDKNSLLADAFEALIGAMYISVGFEKTTESLLGLVKPTLDSAMAMGAGLDGKTALQELVASLGKTTLEYQVTMSGPDHDKSFEAVAVIGGELVAVGTGKSKREAEQSAARAAFEILTARSEAIKPSS